MSEMIERYVHMVVRNLPPRERGEIAAELRSLIQDQLDDRYGPNATPEQIAIVLLELGSPSELASSYQSDLHFIGPDLYPYLMMGLRRIWLIVPALVIFLSVFAAITAAEPVAFGGWLLETILNTAEATLVITAVVVLIFAVIERLVRENDEFAQEMRENEEAFDPLHMPEVDDPRSVDRFEAIFGVILGIIVVLILIYFAQVGGLTLRFDLSNPGEVIPVPRTWLIVLIISGASQVAVQVLVLRRNQWDVASWGIQTLLELVAVFSLYFVLYLPVMTQLATANPALNLPAASIAQGIAILSALPILIGRVSRFVRLWNESSRSAPFAGEGQM